MPRPPGELALPVRFDDEILLKVYAEKRLLALLASGSAFLSASRLASSGTLEGPAVIGPTEAAEAEGIGRNVLLGGVENAEG